MSGFNVLRDMKLSDDTRVTLTYSDGMDVVHCHGTHVEDTVENTDVVERVADVITNSDINVESEWGENSAGAACSTLPGLAREPAVSVGFTYGYSRLAPSEPQMV